MAFDTDLYGDVPWGVAVGRGAPEGLPMAGRGRLRPAWEPAKTCKAWPRSPRPAEDLRKACARLPRAPESYRKLAGKCPGAAQKLPKNVFSNRICPGGMPWDQKVGGGFPGQKSGFHDMPGDVPWQFAPGPSKWRAGRHER